MACQFLILLDIITNNIKLCEVLKYRQIISWNKYMMLLTD